MKLLIDNHGLGLMLKKTSGLILKHAGFSLTKGKSYSFLSGKTFDKHFVLWMQQGGIWHLGKIEFSVDLKMLGKNTQ